MDIRKFFGAPKAGAVKKPTANKGKSSDDVKKEEEKVKSKLSSFKREEKEKPKEKVKEVKKPQNNKTSTKITDSSTKKRAEVEEEIIIDDASDADVIPCSLDSSLISSSKTSRKSETSSKKDSNRSARSKSKEKPSDITEIESGSDSDKDDKQSKSRKSKRESSVKGDKESKTKNGKETATKKTKRNQISDDDDSDEEVSIIKASSSEDEEVIVAKNRNAGKRKRGRKANKVLDSDSDDEDPVPKKTPQGKKARRSATSFVQDSDEEKIETAMDKFLVKKTTARPKVEEAKKEVSAKKSSVNISDFFGSGSAAASRVERPASNDKRKRDEPVKKNDNDSLREFEEELHDDADFLQVLEELDGPDCKKVKLSKSAEEEETTDKRKEKPPAKAGSLASKLASKMKTAPVATFDTEEKDINKNNVNSSPVKKAAPKPSPTPPKLTKRKTYTLEVESKPKAPPPASPLDKKVEDKTPQKKSTPPKATSTGKKNAGNEDDGFGAKRGSSFYAFKMRGGPQALGTKEIPEGAENCLEGLTFVITGVLDSIERDDAKSLVEKYGGKVTGSLSKKTSHLVVGRDPGESKLAKAGTLKVNQLDEDGLFDLIKTLPGKTSKYEIQAKEQLKKEESMKKIEKEKSSLKKLESFQNEKTTKGGAAKPLFTQLKSSDEKTTKEDEIKRPVPAAPKSDDAGQVESLLWVDKHKPTLLKQIIGQQGDKSNAHKLLYWMQRWHQNIIVKGLKAAGNFFGKGGGDGTGFRAALLSGPPGIGKTTTATLVCKEAGFSYVELNASDTRSKRNLKEVVAESLNNTTLLDFMGEDKKLGGDQRSQHHCMIMDEVDGMAGNEDRGGLQELVQLIKNSKIPIICICNDRNSMKMRTLANHCFDLRFQRPRVEQIKGAMMTLAYREGLKIPASAVQEIILASNHDIRQVIHNLSMWSASDKTLTFEQVKEDAQKAQKDMKLGPFDVIRKVFVSDEETRKMSIHDKSDLFFHDYSFAPLFVHENYPNVIPSRAEGNRAKHMGCLARTIDSLCDGDLVEQRIRSQGNWNLLPLQAMYSSVIPGEIMRGSFPQMTNFPSWLGKNSSRGKTDRILQELGTHMALRISGDKRSLNQDYLPALRTSMTMPLASFGAEGVPGVIQMFDDYDIVKDDFDNILEVSKWPNSVDYMAMVESKTKAALTRMYNKGSHMTPYSSGAGVKKKRGGKASAAADEGDLLKEEGEEDDVVVESEEEEDDEPAVVAKPKSKATTAGKGKQAAGKAKGGGGGKGKKK